MQHLDEGTVHAWIDDALPPSEAAAVEAHVEQCAECAARVAEARGLIAGASRIMSSLDHIPVGVIPKQQTPPRSLWHALRLTPARASIAALILVGVASMLTARRGDLPTTTGASPTARSTSAAPATVPIPATTAATAPVPPSAAPPPTREAAKLAKPTASAPIQTPAPAPVADREASAGLAVAKAAEATVRVDSVRVARESAAEQRNVEQRNAEQRSFAGASAAAAQRVMRQALELSVASPEGCYRVLSDSAHSIAVPERFALQRDSIGRNVVLRLSTDNRPDSVLSGFTWQQTSPTSTQLTAPTTRLMLMTTGSGRARLEAPTGRPEVAVQRTACRP